MDKRTFKELCYDVKRVLRKYPGLNINYQGKIPVEINGNFKVIDNNGALQGDFDIRVLISKNYPKGFHHLIETSNKIERIDDRHIDKNGNCCVEILQKTILVGQRGISVIDFFDKYVFKFFCWQLVYEDDPLAIDEWEHYEPGTRRFYYELLGTTNNSAIRKCIEAALKGETPDRNSECICGSRKLFKHCHSSDFYELEKLGNYQLSKDIKVFT